MNTHNLIVQKMYENHKLITRKNTLINSIWNSLNS